MAQPSRRQSGSSSVEFLMRFVLIPLYILIIVSLAMGIFLPTVIHIVGLCGLAITAVLFRFTDQIRPGKLHTIIEHIALVSLFASITVAVLSPPVLLAISFAN